tara:strand:+ start:2295 stop:2642 length:348 start_codon:yes stop_codon:yes gene_type:complete
MKGVWEKITSDWHQVAIVGILGILLFGGLYLQTTIHNSHVQRLEAIHEFQVDFYKSEHLKIQQSGDELFRAFSEEKAQSDMKEQLIERQNKLIQDLIKKVQEYQYWESVDPDKIA